MGARTLRSLARLARRDPVAVGALVAFAVAGVAWLIHPWHPVEDLAITELEVRRVTSSLPLTGAYSSLPFRHPGPLLFLWLWPSYALFGERSSALLAATLWFSGAMAAVALVVARRLGGQLLAALVAVGLAIWSVSSTRPLYLQPWNPYVGSIASVAFLLLAWAMVERRPWALPAAVAVGTWMTQAHIQFAPLVAVIGAVAAAVLVVRVWHGRMAREIRQLKQAAAMAAGVAVVAWSPVLLDVVVHGGDSNPARILHHYRTSTAARTEPGNVSRIARSALSLRPTWAGGPRPYTAFLSPYATLTPWMVPLVAAAALGAARRRAWSDLRGMAVALGGVGVAVASISRITGPIGPWYLVTVEAASLTLAAITAMSLVRSLQHEVLARAPSTSRPVSWLRPAPAVLAVVAVIAMVGAMAALRLPADEQAAAGLAARLQPAVEARIDGAPVLIEARSGYGGWVQAALALQLERDGHHVFATTTLKGKYPATMEAAPPGNAVRFVVVTDPPANVRWAEGVEVVASGQADLSSSDQVLRVVVVEAPLRAPFVIAHAP